MVRIYVYYRTPYNRYTNIGILITHYTSSKLFFLIFVDVQKLYEFPNVISYYIPFYDTFTSQLSIATDSNLSIFEAMSPLQRPEIDPHFCKCSRKKKCKPMLNYYVPTSIW